MKTDTEVVSIRIPSRLKKRIGAIAKKMDRSQNWVIGQALGNYVHLYDWQVEAIKKAVRKADAGGPFYSHEEVMQSIHKQLKREADLAGRGEA